jgi:hypothetical protein
LDRRAAQRQARPFLRASGKRMSSEEEKSPTNLPADNATINWLSYHLRVDFHPPIRMSRKAGHEFAPKIYSALEAGSTQIEDDEWKFRGAGQYSGMQVAVSKNSIIMSVVEPLSGQEWYEERFAEILAALAKQYPPQMVLFSGSMINGLLDIEGDARVFLGGNLMLMHPKRLEPFDKELYILGVRLYFPSADKKLDEGRDDDEWAVDVKVESWIEDPTKLYLEADADWETAVPWTKDSPRQLADHLQTVSEFMQRRLLAFLRQPPDIELDDDIEEGDDHV